MGEAVRKWQAEKYSLSFPDQLHLQNTNTPKEEVQKKASNVHESVTVSRSASPLCIRWYFSLLSIIKYQQIEKARPQPHSPCEVENRECLTPSV